MTFFDSTEFLIGIQVLVFLLLVIGLLALLMRRQKKIIQELQSILTEYRDDISGDTMRAHLKREIDNTTAHCRQDTIALKQDLSPEDMAISLRYSALQAELALMQEDNGAKQHWRDQIKAYEELAHALHEIIRSRVEYGNRILKDAHVDELAAKDHTIGDLQTTRNTLQEQVNQLKPLQSFVRTLTEGNLTPHEIEQKLHRALLDICDNFKGTEKLRELVFLLHEAFHEVHSADSAMPSQASSDDDDLNF